jgi:hypothetical protein
MVGVSALVFGERDWRLVAATVAGAAVVVTAPAVAVMLAAAAGFAYTLRRLQAGRRSRVEDAADLAVLCDLTALSLTAGLGLQASLALASSEAGGRVGAEVAGVLRAARVGGTAAAMGSADGVARPLYRTVGRAAVTGAGVVQAVTHLADDLNAELTARKLESVRRKPVAMLFPLTLLILPGFLLLAVAPAILDALGRLDL